MFLTTHYFIYYHTAPAPLTSLKMSSMIPPDIVHWLLLLLKRPFPQVFTNSNFISLKRLFLTKTNQHLRPCQSPLTQCYLFYLQRLLLPDIYMFLFIVSLLHQILVYVSTQKTKVLNKYLLSEYNDQSVYLGLPKIIFLLGSEIINSIQRYTTLESCLSFWSLTSGRNIG